MEEQRCEKRRPNKLFWIILLIISVALFAAALAILLVQFLPRSNDFSGFKNSNFSSVSELELPENPIDFKAVKAENEDVCGWMKLDGTVIDYPILRSDTDMPEDFYLDHDIYGKKNRAGSIYIQRFNNVKLTDKNTVIYGHNMLNGTMFAALKKFRNKQFFDEHDTITIYTPGHIYTYKIFSAFLYDDRHILNSFYMGNSEGHAAFIEDCLNPPTLVKNVREDITVTEEDKIITLSTCTSVDSERYLVAAVLVDDVRTK